MLVRDKRRWNYADQNKDGALTREEYAHYLHPEEVEHMKEVVVLVRKVIKLFIIL